MEVHQLEAKNLFKSYQGKKVVHDVSLQVSTSQIVGLLGPNGAGKTTSFYMIVGLIRSDKGEIFLGEKSITKLPIHERARLGIGYLPQEASVFRELTVEENILSALEVKDYSKSEKQTKLDQLINDFGLDKIRTSLGMSLSGGERRRVEIARVLALSPKFVLLDEPFAGVDPIAVLDIQNVIRDLKDRGIGVLITDHNVRETLGIVDCAYILNQGKLLVKGQPEEILENDEARKVYLGEKFRM